MKVLLSIKPQFADRIFEGSKDFEYRRTIFNNGVTTVIVYASSPTKMVIGEFDVEEVIRDTPERLWKLTKERAGVSKEFFFEYFDGKEHGYAIKVGKKRKYKMPKSIIDDFGVIPPQSFVYLNVE